MTSKSRRDSNSDQDSLSEAEVETLNNQINSSIPISNSIASSTTSTTAGVNSKNLEKDIDLEKGEIALRSDSPIKNNEEEHFGEVNLEEPSSNPIPTTPKFQAASEDHKGIVKREDGVIVVDWLPSDPLNPKNWPNRRRMLATLIVASFTFLSPASSTMIAPASGQIAEKFGITNDVEISSVTSIFVLAYAVGPLFLGPLSELFGRAVVLQLSNLFYLIFNLACGFATNKEQILAFRFLAGLGGSAPLAVGAGTLSDLWRAHERGKAAALYSLGPLLGPAIGPIAGGWLAQQLPVDGYRWVFFSSSIFCFLIQILGLILLSETYSPVLLKRQAQALKKEMGLEPNSLKVITIFEERNGSKSVKEVVTQAICRPFTMLFYEHIIQIFSLYMMITYGIIYITIVTTTDIFTRIYSESIGIASTNFIALGGGFMFWSQVQARCLDIVYRKLRARSLRKGGSDKGVPEYRLPMILPASIFLPVGLLIYGWSSEYDLHWIITDIGLFLIAAAMIGIFQCITTYLIDTYTLYAASALAASSSMRSICGFAFPLFAPQLFSALGYGKGCTLLAVVSILMIPAAPVLYVYGSRVRAKSHYAAS